MVVKVHFSTLSSFPARRRSRKFAPIIGFVLLVCVLAMGYYILQRTAPGAAGPPADEVEALRTRLEEGNAPARRQALQRLISLRAEDVLARCLASEQGEVVQLATNGLWECWLSEEGDGARRRMEEGIAAMGAGDLDSAFGVFAELQADFPDWAEAVNKQATVLYLMGKTQQSIELCQQVVAMKPDHFGAWNGLAICAIQVEDWSVALQAVRESLRLQPHSRTNQQLLRLVESRLPVV